MLAYSLPRLSRWRAEPHHGSQLDIVRCPLCRGPLQARMARAGPYFHCLCKCPQERRGVSPPVRHAPAGSRRAAHLARS